MRYSFKIQKSDLLYLVGVDVALSRAKTRWEEAWGSTSTTEEDFVQTRNRPLILLHHVLRTNKMLTFDKNMGIVVPRSRRPQNGRGHIFVVIISSLWQCQWLSVVQLRWHITSTARGKASWVSCRECAKWPAEAAAGKQLFIGVSESTQVHDMHSVSDFFTHHFSHTVSRERNFGLSFQLNLDRVLSLFFDMLLSLTLDVQLLH